MKKVMAIFAAVTLVLVIIGTSVQATPERAAIIDKKCGECHSGGRHMGPDK